MNILGKIVVKTMRGQSIRLFNSLKIHYLTQYAKRLPLTQFTYLNRTCINNTYHRRNAMFKTEQLQDENDDKLQIDDIFQENEFAQRLFHNSECYSTTIVPKLKVKVDVSGEEIDAILQNDSSKMKDEEFLLVLKKLSYYCANENNKLTPDQCQRAMEFLSVQYENFNALMLKKILKYLVPIHSNLKELNRYKEFLAELDKLCKQEFKNFSLEDQLFLCDAFYCLDLAVFKTSKYIWYAVRKLGAKISKLSPKNLVQYSFILNTCRNPSVNMYELELHVRRCIDQLTIDELGIVALGFFKTSSKIRSKDLIEEIIQQTINNIDRVHSVSLASIMKALRFSMTQNEISLFRTLLVSSKKYIPRYTLMTLVHTAHASAKSLTYDDDLIQAILQRTQSELQTARLKDVERIIHVMSTFNIKSDHPTYQVLIDNLYNREKEFQEHPQILPTILLYLAYAKIFPKDLIAKVMDPQYISKLQKGNVRNIRREYLFLDQSLKLEVPDYTGPFLPKSYRKYLTKRYSSENVLSSGVATNMKAFAIDFLYVLRMIIQYDINLHQILPHITSGTIPIGLDQDKKIVPYETLSTYIPHTSIKSLDGECEKGVNWFVFILQTNGMTLKGINTLSGLQNALERQLTHIGYKTIIFPQATWTTLHMNEKTYLLKEILSKHMGI